MTRPLPLEMTDGGIEAMLAARAGGRAPSSVTAGILAGVTMTPQQRPWPWVDPRAMRSGIRALLVAAALTVVVVTASVLLGGGFRGIVPTPIASPTPAPSGSTRPTPSPTSTPTAAPTAAPTATPDPTVALAPVVDHAPLIVYHYGSSAIDLYTLDAFTGDKTPMGKMQRGAEIAGQSVQWSDDRQSAFVWADGDTVRARVDIPGRSVQGLVGVPPPVNSDSVSPKGDRIARLDDNNDVALLDLNGDTVATLPLPDGIRPLIGIHWTRDASAILVTSCLPCSDTKFAADPWHIFVAPVDGSPVRMIGNFPLSYIGVSDISPDRSTALVTDASCGGDPCTGGIGVVDLATGAYTRLTDGGEGGGRWSPDGTRIVFTQVPLGDAGVDVIDADGSHRTQVVTRTNTKTFLEDPHWSPNGEWILYRVVPSDGDVSVTGIGDLWIVPASGGAPRLVAKHAIADW